VRVTFIEGRWLIVEASTPGSQSILAIFLNDLRIVLELALDDTIMALIQPF
jgi:hypothetical protein